MSKKEVKAIYDAQSLGFQSQPQMRYLLRMLYEYPDRYGWVADVLREHGVPAREEALHTYWEGPYNLSPKTPSYTYTGKKKKESCMKERMQKFAEKMKTMGKTVLADRVDSGIQFLDKELEPHEVANSFWALHANEIQAATTPQELMKWFLRFNKFEPMTKLEPQEQEEAKRFLGDLVKGRKISK